MKQATRMRTINDVSSLWNITRNAIFRWVAEGVIPPPTIRAFGSQPHMWDEADWQKVVDAWRAHSSPIGPLEDRADRGEMLTAEEIAEYLRVTRQAVTVWVGRKIMPDGHKDDKSILVPRVWPARVVLDLVKEGRIGTLVTYCGEARLVAKMERRR